MSTAPAVTPIQAGGQGNIESSTLCLSVTLGAPGTKRKMDADKVTTDADKSLLRVSKEILDSEELRAIRRHDSETRQWLREHALPSLFRSGVYRVRHKYVDRVDDYLERRRAERQGMIDTFMAAYRDTSDNGLMAKARTKLASEFDDGEYPDANKMEALFTWDARWLSFSTPEALRAISRALFQRERDKEVRNIAAAAEEYKGLLRARYKEVVDHMVERLSPTTDGKKKIIRTSMVANLQEAIDAFDFCNAHDDAELSAQVERMRSLVSGVDPEHLRDDEAFRNNIRVGFEQVQLTLDSLVVAAPRRRISLGEEEA